MAKKVFTYLHPNWYLTHIVFLVALYLGIYFFNMFVPTDFDMGWHLRYGSDVLSDGVILRGNDFSSEMVGFAGYNWVNTNWGLEVIRYLIYQKFSLVGLSIMGGITLVASSFFLVKTAQLDLWESAILLPLFSVAEYALDFHSFRGQEVSIFFTFLLLYFLFQIDRGKWKYGFVIFIFFIFWVNIHAQVFMGVVLVSVWAACRIVFTTWNLRKNVSFINSKTPSKAKMLMRSSLPFLLLAIGAAVATVLSPFGIYLHIVSFLLPSSEATKYVSEWAALSPASGLTFYMTLLWVILMNLGFIIAVREKTFQKYLPFYIVSMMLFFIALHQMRYVWTMFPVGGILIGLFLKKLQPSNAKVSIIGSGIIVSIFLVFTFTSLIPTRSLDDITWNTYCRVTHCSIQGATILSKYFSHAKLWTDYNYGGWLIWNFPDVKPVIDGRMHLWVDTKTGYNPFMDMYLPLEWGKADADASKFDVFFVQNYRPLKEQLDTLVQKKKWKLVFQDEYASIYARATPSAQLKPNPKLAK